MSHTSQATQCLSNPLHPLIVCGQGTYRDGHFYAEYTERDIYVRHALSIPALCQTFGYNAVVCSGSYTKSETPDLSEAKSFHLLWEEQACVPLDAQHKPLPCFLEEAALDSAQNLIFGLMQMRLALREAGQGEQPFRRIGLAAVWKYKRNRFQWLADNLGISTQLYFHGLAGAEESSDMARALDSERRQVEVLRQTQDPLMLAMSWEAKRKKRDTNPKARAQHFGLYASAFPRCFAAADIERWQRKSAATNAAFREAFLAEVMGGVP